MFLAEDIKKLTDLGLNSDQIIGVFSILESVTERDKKRDKDEVKLSRETSRRSHATERQRRRRERIKLEENHKVNKENPTVTKSVTERDIVTKPIREDTFLLTSEEDQGKKVSKPLLSKMPFVTLPPEWEKWAMSEFGWTAEVAQDTWQLFFEYWVNGKGRAVKREKWGATWRTWCRNQAGRMPNKARGRFNENSAPESIETRIARMQAKGM